MRGNPIEWISTQQQALDAGLNVVEQADQDGEDSGALRWDPSAGACTSPLGKME